MAKSKPNQYAERDAMVEAVEIGVCSVNLEDSVAIGYASVLIFQALNQYFRALERKAKISMTAADHALAVSEAKKALRAAERWIAKWCGQAVKADRHHRRIARKAKKKVK